MALLPSDANKSLKRSASDAGFPGPTSTKLRRTQNHIHKLHYKSQGPASQIHAFQDHAHSQKLLDRSITLALETVGFAAAEPLALQSFRALAEEYMAHVLSSVNKSMHASRRARAIPQDYLYALRTHKLSLRALQVHLDPPVPVQKSVISQEIDLNRNADSSFQAPELLKSFEASAPQPPPHYPKHFPHLPSSHTYKATSRYTPRESDPRKIRERATEEGRMGEAALQKFVEARSKAHQREAEDLLPKGAMTLRSKRFAAWKEAMMADEEDADMSNAIDSLSGTNNPGDRGGTASRRLEVGPIVNADQAFMRKIRANKVTSWHRLI